MDREDWDKERRESILADFDYNNVMTNKLMVVREVANGEMCNLRQIPESFLNCADNIVFINLNYNYFEELPRDFTSTFTNLKELLLVGNMMLELPSNIGNLVKLEKLILDNNRFIALPDSICDLRCLKVLSASTNSLRNLPAQIENVSSLKELNLKYNYLTSLPATFSQLVHLEKLDLSYNDLNGLPQDFGCLKSLREILLVQNSKLESLGPSFGNLSQLELLDASSCDISDLPEFFSSTNCLISLDLAQNSLSKLPDWINHLTKLQVLNLQSTNLTGCPFSEYFGTNSVDLVNLNLSGNKIEKLPESFSKLMKLETFDAGSGCLDFISDGQPRRGNMITRLPKVFGFNFRSLVKMVLNECNIQSLPKRFGAHLTSLTYLDLSTNSISILPSTFSCMTNLRVCLLFRNCIENLPTEFGDLISLVELRISHNRLTFLPASFAHLRKLKVLDLSGNNIAVIPSPLARLENLKALSLGIPLADVSKMSLLVSQDAIRRLELAISAGVEDRLNISGSLNTSVSLSENGHEIVQANVMTSNGNGYTNGHSSGHTNGLSSTGVNGCTSSNGHSTADEDWDYGTDGMSSFDTEVIGNPGSFAPWYTTELDRGYIPIHDLAPGTALHRRKRKIANLVTEVGQFDDPEIPNSH